MVGQRRTRRVAGVEQLEQDAFQAVFGTGGIAGGRADTAIFLLDDRLGRQLLARRIAPQGREDVRVEPFRKGFGKAVGERLQREVAIIVMRSEANPSEIQSLMRTTIAVIDLKKK